MSSAPLTYETSLPVRGSSDVIVVGGGIAGVAAALAARRSGASVTLLEKTISLGGLATLGNVIMYLPICDGRGHQVIAGIAEELLRLSVAATGPDRAGRVEAEAAIPECWRREASEEERSAHRFRAEFNAASLILALERILVAEGITVVYDTAFVDAVRSDGRITHVVAADKGGLCAYRSGAVVDASGDADVCISVGEATISRATNVSCGWFYCTEAGRLKVVRASERYAKNPAELPEGSSGFVCDDGPSVTAQVLGSRTLIRERIERMERDLEHGHVVPVAIPQVPTFRMTRRLIGKAEPAAADAQKPRGDSIGKTGDWRESGPVFHIPFDSLRGETTNLFAAGRIISVADDLWDATRAIPACAMTGQAAGTAAALATHARERSSFVDVGELRGVLERQGVLL